MTDCEVWTVSNGWRTVQCERWVMDDGPDSAVWTVSNGWRTVSNGWRTVQWPDYRKYLSPDILYIPYKWFAPQTPLKKIRKIRKKFKAKAIQGHIPWLNLKKNFPISFSQYENKNVGTLFFRSMRQAQNTDTYALNQLGVSQNSSPLLSNFTADKHIWHPPWARM